MGGLEGKKKKLCSWGKKILALHAILGIAPSPRLAAIFTPICILPGLSHTSPAAKTHLLLLPHLQKVFPSFFSLLHTRPFAPSSTPRHATSQSFGFLQAARGELQGSWLSRLPRNAPPNRHTKLRRTLSSRPSFCWAPRGGCWAEPSQQEASGTASVASPGSVFYSRAESPLLDSLWTRPQTLLWSGEVFPSISGSKGGGYVTS